MNLYYKDKDGNRVTVPPLVVPVDDTLSKSGRAADAKKTGDEIARLQKDMGWIMPITKVEDYLYEYVCVALDYAYASEYFKNKEPEVALGGCSSTRSGNFYGRNFDWMYDSGVSFVVRTPARSGLHEVIGVSGHLAALTRELIESGVYDEAYRILPFYLADGINDSGLVCNINVVPIAYGKTTGTVPTEDKTEEICALMLPRFVLDHFASATDAVGYLKKHVSVYVPDTLHQMNYEVHAMIADDADTYAVEFISNEIVVTKIDDHPYMTNFHLHGVTFNQDGSVYTPGTQDGSHNAMVTNGVEEFGSGLERYNIIAADNALANSYGGMRSLLDKLTYTRTYNRNEVPFWFTEYIGGNANVASGPAEFGAVVDEYIGYYETRQRGDGKTWQTVHSAVYDIRSRNLVLRVQEGGTDHEYGFSYALQNDVAQLKEEKVDRHQGVEFAGKVLGIDDDGNVTPVEGGAPGPGKVILTIYLIASDSSTVNGVTVDVYNASTGSKVATETYAGQPLAFSVAEGFPYKVEFGRWYGYVRPKSITTGVLNADQLLSAEYKRGETYAFHFNGAEADPSAKITYLEDNSNFAPAHMNYDTGLFDYGDWKDAFFFPRPCMLKYDGTVDYYLDPDDYTFKEDGTLSDIANLEYEGNAMIEWGGRGTIYYKVLPDDGDIGSATVYISDTKHDPGYVCWSFINSQGIQVEHFYTPIYSGSLDGNGKLRSISGQNVTKTNTAQAEINAAMRNNPDDNIMWYTEVFADIQLINFLLILIGKSTDTQSTFGNGNINGLGEKGLLPTGSMNNRGMFWGANDSTHGVKVFGMENWWANQWRRYAGHIVDKGTQKVKMTWGAQDSSTTIGYNLTGAGYTTVGCTPVGTFGGYIKDVEFHDGSMFVKNVSASATTYLCDGMWFSNTTVSVPFRGGACSHGLACGAFCCAVNNGASRADWDFGAALSCKPLAL